MNKTTELVRCFHEVFEHPVGNLTEIEPLKIRQLRIKLLFEEIAELAEAGDVTGTLLSLCHTYIRNAESNKYSDGDNVDQLEELDALCDIQYVLDGKKLTSGLSGELFSDAFLIVHANNMTKAHKSREHARETVLKNVMAEGFEIREKNGLTLLYNADHKLTKPHDHVKVSLQPLLNEYKGKELSK